MSRKKRDSAFFSSDSNNPGRPQTAQSSELKDHEGGSRVFSSVLTLFVQLYQVKVHASMGPEQMQCRELKGLGDLTEFSPSATKG